MDVASLSGPWSPVAQAAAATLFTWLMTALGAALVLFLRAPGKRTMDAMLGFASGIMVAASCWSLLDPAIEMAEGGAAPAWVPAATGFLLGGVFLWGLDHLLPHLHRDLPLSEAEGVATSWRRTTLLVLAVTLHNVPEGLAVGVAFAAVAGGAPSATGLEALALALGIGLQNFPEGAAVSFPLLREGMSRRRAFWYGQLSGMVEPAAGILGAILAQGSRPVLPYALSFAAGAMLYVVVEELVPEARRHGNGDVATAGCMVGFTVMMVLDVALGS